MNYKENLRKTYNRIAEDWNQDHAKDDWWIGGTNKFVDLVGKGSTVLDIGCGSGIKSKFLAEKGLKVVGIDLSEKLIDIAKEAAPSCCFYVMDMQKIKFQEKFDGIFAQACLLHVPKKEAAETVKQWSNILKPGGYFYIAVKENKKVEEEIVEEEDYGYHYERFFSYYTKEEVEKYLKRAGLKIVFSKVVFSGRNNWIQVIAQKIKESK